MCRRSQPSGGEHVPLDRRGGRVPPRRMPLASERPRPCERVFHAYRWDGCVHLDVSRIACLNGCSECIAHVVGDESRIPTAHREDQCWSEPEPGCAIAFKTRGATTWGSLHAIPAPTYECAMIDGVCTTVPMSSEREPRWSPDEREVRCRRSALETPEPAKTGAKLAQTRARLIETGLRSTKRRNAGRNGRRARVDVARHAQRSLGSTRRRPARRDAARSFQNGRGAARNAEKPRKTAESCAKARAGCSERRQDAANTAGVRQRPPGRARRPKTCAKRPRACAKRASNRAERAVSQESARAANERRLSPIRDIGVFASAPARADGHGARIGGDGALQRRIVVRWG